MEAPDQSDARIPMMFTRGGSRPSEQAACTLPFFRVAGQTAQYYYSTLKGGENVANKSGNDKLIPETDPICQLLDMCIICAQKELKKKRAFGEQRPTKCKHVTDDIGAYLK